MNVSGRMATLEVAGMTCTNCEHHVADALNNAGAIEASADHHRGIAKFVWPTSASEDDLRAAVIEAGYTPGAINVD